LHAALLDAVGQAVVATDLAGQIIYWNRAAEQMYGWTTSEAVGRLLFDLLPSPLSAEQTVAVMTAVTAGDSWTEDIMVPHRDGREFPALVTTSPVFDEHGELIATISVGTDITRRKRDEETARHLCAIFDSTGDAVIGKSPSGEIVSWNRAAEDLFGYPASEVIGHNISLLAPDDRQDEFRDILEQVVAGNTVRNLETVRRRSDGVEVDVSLTVSPTYDVDGTVMGASAIARDITERRAMETTLRHNALHDELTGLPNRALLTDRLSHALSAAKRSKTSVAVLFLDLDQFKTVNDAVGHDAGDRLLVEVARRITAVTRADDTVARFGGDGFVIVSTDTNESAAEHVAARLLDSLVDPVGLSGTPLYITASIGIAVSPPMEADALMSNAEEAMYEAKARGRGRARVFDAESAQDAPERLQLSNDLRQALEENALEVWYQPIIGLATGELIGVEALCRWNHPTLGMVPPISFVNVAEVTGLVSALDDWVLHRACLDARILIDRGVLGAEGYMGVNVSARNVVDLTLKATVRSAVKGAGIPYERLMLEVTETGAMSDPENAARLLDELHALGVAIGLDDFGTGYSSLSYLQQFPVNTIKIDRTFVQHITSNRDDLAITVSMIDLAKSAQIGTVAEGVETMDQLILLRQLGCRAGQGYLWSAAVPLNELIALVNDQPNRRFPTSDAPEQMSGRRAPALEVTVDNGLRMLLDMHHQGASLDTIAAALNQEGYKTPSVLRWHRSTVARVIADTVYPTLVQGRPTPTRT
jgi:diguanylate cyclase (GGDEF)-like protein/PAS domain S-box-containing protein